MTDIRKEVMATLIDDAVRLDEAGLDCWKDLQRLHPAVPATVIAQACAEAMHAEEEAWWRTLEKTIGGEIIKNALASAPTNKHKA